MMHFSRLLRHARDTLQRTKQYFGVAANALGWTDDRPITGPLYADISISDPCNHRCVMCHFHPAGKDTPLSQFGGRHPGMMDLGTFKEITEDLYRMGTREVDLVGRGEPLLNPRVLDMVAHAKSRGFRVKMISNGSRLTAARAQGLADLGLDLFQVSLNAARPQTYPKIHVSETPAAFLALKARLKELTAARSRSRDAKPCVTLSFAIGALNYAELVEMVETIDELGADAGHFQHWLPVTASAESTALSDAQYDELVAKLVPAAADRAAQLGVRTNLRAFAAAPPSYRLDREDTGPGVVPCYIGSYFTAILSNGSVMPCCQTEKSIGSLADQGFEAIWRGEAYSEFRRAGRHLPTPSPALATCQCDRCYFRPHNIAVHNMLHPLARLRRPEQRVSLKHLVRMTRLDQ
jgi:AdoMet-dependent heme synthase